MLILCQHCESHPAVPGSDRGLCPACLGHPAVATLYTPRPHHTPPFLAKLRRLAARYKARRPLFPASDRRHPLFGRLQKLPSHGKKGAQLDLQSDLRARRNSDSPPNSAPAPSR